MIKIKNYLIIFSSLALGLVSITPATPAYAAVKDDIQSGACGAAGQSPCNPQSATSNLNNTIRRIINIMSIIAGVLAVAMLIIGGIRYVTSAGNDQAVAGAKRTIMYAVVGLLIVALAQVIVRFVLRNTL